MPKELTKKKHETSTNIIIFPLAMIELDEDDMTKIDDEVDNKLNTLFSCSTNLDDDLAMKSGELHDNPSLALDIVPLASCLTPTCYID